MGGCPGKQDRGEMNIEAMITSVNDPQMDRCLEAARNQTVPFSNIIHINMVCPLNIAFNEGMRKTTEEWVMDIGGDMILDADAVERVIRYMSKDSGSNISGYYFSLNDTFLKCRIGYVGVLRGSLYRDIVFKDTVASDKEIVRELRSKGWMTRKLDDMYVGTHFDSPDEFQVFRRFYLHGTRYHDRLSLRNRLESLYNSTGDPLYEVGIKAIIFADKKGFYPGSHNIEFDKHNFEEFSI